MEPDSYALATRAQLLVLQQLVECTLAALSPAQRHGVLADFQRVCEGSMAVLLNDATRDSTIDAMRSAQDQQWARLSDLGLRAP